MYELSQEETTPQEDCRLQHALVYFFQNKAPKRIIERTLLEQFTDRNLSFDERYTQMCRQMALLMSLRHLSIILDRVCKCYKSVTTDKLLSINLRWS